MKKEISVKRLTLENKVQKEIIRIMSEGLEYYAVKIPKLWSGSSAFCKIDQLDRAAQILAPGIRHMAMKTLDKADELKRLLKESLKK